MLISNLQDFLRSMVPALTALGLNAAGQKSATGGMEALASALEPFQAWDAHDLAEWLKLAQTYRDTGVVPDLPTSSTTKPKARSTRVPAAPKVTKAPKRSTAEVVAELRDLQADRLVDPAQVKQVVDALTSLTGDQLKEVQKEFLSVAVGRTKADQLAAIRKRINDHHAARDRVEGILS